MIEVNSILHSLPAGKYDFSDTEVQDNDDLMLYQHNSTLIVSNQSNKTSIEIDNDPLPNGFDISENWGTTNEAKVSISRLQLLLVFIIKSMTYPRLNRNDMV